MATVARYVDTGSSGGDGTTDATSGGTAAYASLSSWEANVTNAAADTLTVDCAATDTGSGNLADTTTFTLSLTTHLTSGTCTIRGNSGKATGLYTGNALISTAHYRHTSSSANNIDVQEPNITFDGVQFENTTASGFRCILKIDTAGAALVVQNCRFRGNNTVRSGIGPDTAIENSTTKTFQNNLFSNFATAGIEYKAGQFRSPTLNIYHNTIYSSGGSVKCIALSGNGNNTGATVNIKNNICANTTAPFSNITGATTNYDYNWTDSGANGTTNEQDLAASWATSAGTAQSSDFSLIAGLTTGGTVNSITTDINGTSRGSPPDAGAFEFTSGGGGTTYSDTYSESVTIDATLANVLTAIGSVSEAVTLAEAMATTATFPNALSEAITLAATFADGNIFNDTLTETVTLAETFSVNVIWANTLAEAVALSDAVASVAIFVGSLTEAVTVADSYAASGGDSSIWTVQTQAPGTWTPAGAASGVWAVVPGTGGSWTPQ